MNKFRIRDREAGNTLVPCSTREEAERTLAKFEEEDKREGIYTPDFYEIVEGE